LGLVRQKIQSSAGSLLYVAALVSTALWAALGAWGSVLHAPAVLNELWAPVRSEYRLLLGVAALAVLSGLALVAGAALRWHDFDVNGRGNALIALSEAVVGLMLVEQLLRNLPPDSRWNAKPVCLGLGLVFCFDLFLYSQAA